MQAISRNEKAAEMQAPSLSTRSRPEPIAPHIALSRRPLPPGVPAPINLSIAENVLPLHLHPPIHIPPLSHLSRVSINPDEVLLQQVTRIFETQFTKASISNPQRRFAFVSGATCAVDALAVCITKKIPDARALMIGPGYGGFTRDLWTRSGVRRVVANVNMDSKGELHNALPVALQQAYVDAGAERSGIAFVLVISPDNPSGTIFDRHTIKGIISWARCNALQLVFDEAYALSIHDSSASFISASEVCKEDNGLFDDVHIIWTLSKDLGVSGMRIGVIYSQNEGLISAIRELDDFIGVSAYACHQAAQLLAPKNMESFIPKNRKLLKEAYQNTAEVLQYSRIPFAPAQAGFFVWIDLRRWMNNMHSETQSWERELELWDLFRRGGVLLTPGRQCYSDEPGFFRLCFAAVPAEDLVKGLTRLQTVIAEIGEE